MKTPHECRPGAGEFAEYYARYTGQVPDGNIVQLLETQAREVAATFGAIPETKGNHRYAEGKWSIKEILGHLVDTERVFAYRALRFSRGDATPLASVDQDLLVAGGHFNARPLADIVDEFRHLRAANIVLFRSFTEEMMSRGGEASGWPVTTRALPWIIAGHTVHHLKVLRERYL